MTQQERQRTREWLEFYRANRPRHEGSADVPTQLAFVMKALDGVFATLARLAAEDARDEIALVQAPAAGTDRMIVAPRVNPIVRAIAEDALTFAAPGEDPRVYLRGVAERLAMAGQDRIVERLAIAVRDAEALIGQCPARQSWRRSLCGAYFVRARPQQTFCSPRCQSRYTTMQALQRQRAAR